MTFEILKCPACKGTRITPRSSSRCQICNAIGIVKIDISEITTINLGVLKTYLD